MSGGVVSLQAREQAQLVLQLARELAQEDGFTPKPRRILRLPVVIDRVGLGRSAIYDQVKDGTFPAPRELTKNGKAVGWFESEIDDWLAARPVSTGEE